ncbi:MAG: radical SAM protein [Methanobacteriota archaeon]|nr:MAG: radical SAM protein [Euryarchaeota archaeon]
MSAVVSSLRNKKIPRQTESMCPECLKVIPATLFESEGALKMKKKCEEHGEIEDVIWSDIELYKKAESFAFDGVGIENPAIESATNCPFECGLCNLHYTHTCLANVDLTNRCNLRCPICFANANDAGYVFEPTYEQTYKMLKVLREERPVPTVAVQFSGGEPTIHPDFFRILEGARELGFAQIQIATNGLKLAEPGFAKKAAESGLHTIYLQFDGLKEDNYIQARGRPLLDIKKKAIEEVRKLKPDGPSVVLVPTIAMGINDDQVGEILKFGLENRDVIRGVNFQPVSLAGRITVEERRKLRFTLSDLAIKMQEQIGWLEKDDWYPVPFVVPISKLISVIQDEPKLSFTTHPACGLATYLYVPDEGNPIPITRFVDVEGLMKDLWELANKIEQSKRSFFPRIKALKILRKHYKKDKAPDKLGSLSFIKSLSTMMDTGDKEGISEFTWKWFYVGGMHFQDLYKYDIQRTMRCAIHYATPDGRIIPFCAYNTGPNYREEVEKKFSIPLDEWRKKHGSEDF